MAETLNTCRVHLLQAAACHLVDQLL